MTIGKTHSCLACEVNENQIPDMEESKIPILNKTDEAAIISPGDVDLIRTSRGKVHANVTKNKIYSRNVTNKAAIVPPGIS